MIRKYKFTILAAVLLVVPFGLYALWMMYGWLFFSFPFSEDEFQKTIVAVVLVLIGSAIASVAYKIEYDRVKW